MSSLQATLKRIEKYKASLVTNQSKFKPIPWTSWVEMAESTLISSGGKFTQFKPYDYQVQAIKDIEANYLSVVVKGRQLGLSQIVCTWLLYRAITEPGFTAIVISKTQGDTSILAARIRQMAGQLSDYFEMENDSLLQLKVKGAGQIFFRNSKIDACRGIDSVSALVFDEAAFIDELPLIFSAASPALSMVGDNARIIFLSTPNGIEGCPFAERLISNNAEGIDPLAICEDIRESRIAPYQSYVDEIGTAKIFIHWKSHPIYSARPNYIENIALRLNEPISKVRQEYDLSFNDNETSLFSAEIISQCRTDELPEGGSGLYFIGVDMAGQGNDYTVFTIFKQLVDDEGNTKLELTEMYRKKDGTTDSHIIALSDLIRKYDAFKVGIEVNSIGQVVYERISVMHRDVEFKDIRTTNSSKLIMLEQLKYALEKSYIKYNEKKFSKLTNELLGYKNIDGKLGAVGKFNDDIVMSTVMAVDAWFDTRGRKNAN